MISYDDIKRLTQPPLDSVPVPSETEQWWTAQGVDYAGLQKFCQEEGHDNYTTVLPQVLMEHYGLVAVEGEGGGMYAGAPIEALPGIIVSLSAMAMEVGFLLGWVSFQKAMGKPTVPVEL